MTAEEKLSKVRWNIKYYTEEIEKHQLQIETYKAFERELMAQLPPDKVESADIPVAPLDAVSQGGD